MIEQAWRDPECGRLGWPAGPWDAEPDKVQWVDAATGLACLAKRHAQAGHWCGYVGVDETHPWHGKEMEEVPEVQVHGGLTFAEGCQQGPIASTVCHLPQPGEPEHLWWLGFDCAHLMDHSPARESFARIAGLLAPLEGTRYRDLAYVRRQCAELAAQVKAASEK
jgi:hypothetical protein